MPLVSRKDSSPNSCFHFAEIAFFEERELTQNLSGHFLSDLVTFVNVTITFDRSFPDFYQSLQLKA